MSSPLWERFLGTVRVITAGARSLGLFRERRAALAERVRQAPEWLNAVVWIHIRILFVVGMMTAGLVLLPVGVLLLADSLLKESVDRQLLGGLVLCGTGLLYVLVPAVLLAVRVRVVLDRLRGRADRLAARIAGTH